jgi:hypothetical protein
MMTDQHQPALTKEQTASVNSLIEQHKSSIVAAVTQVIQDNQEKIKSEASTEIKKAVEEHQQVVIAKVAAGQGEKGESTLFKVALVLLPLVTTALLGFYIDRKVDQGKQEVTTRLAIQEEFYKRKLTIYEKTYEQMAEFNQALNDLRADPSNIEAGVNAFKRMTEFDKFRRTNALYISPKVMSELGLLWETAAGVVSDPKAAQKNPLTEKIAGVEKLMEAELQVEALGRVSDILKGKS